MKSSTPILLASLLLLCGCETTGDFLKNAGSVLNSVVNELDAAAAKGRQAGSQQSGAGGGAAAMAPAVATASAGPRSIGSTGSISVDGNIGAVALREPAGDAPSAAADAGTAAADSAAAGGGLDKSLFVGRNRLDNAGKHFAERLEGFPQNVMEAVLLANQDGSPAIKVDVDTGHVFASVGIRVVPERYATFARSFRELLEAVCAGREERTVSFGTDKHGKDSFVADGVVRSKPQDRENGPFPVVVATPADPLRLSWPVSEYSLDGRMFDVLCKTLDDRFPKTAVVEVWLQDEDGDPVVGGKAAVVRNGAKDNVGGSLQCLPIALNDSYEKKVYIAPYAGVQTSSVGGQQSSMRLPASAMRTGRIDLGEVSEQDLADVVAFEVRIEFR